MAGLAAESTAPVQVLGNSTTCIGNGDSWSREHLFQEGVFLSTGRETALL